MSSIGCPRARRRAKIRAWASEVRVHWPCSSGTRPSSTHRRNVAGETSRRRAASAAVMGMTGRRYPGYGKKKRRDRGRGPAACGQCGPLPRPAAFVRGDALRGASPSLPGLLPRLVAGGLLLAAATVNETRRSGLEVRVLALDQRAVARVHGLGDRDQAERRRDVAAGLDAATRDRDGDVLLALEVLVGGLRGHLHLHPGLPRDVVGPLPAEVVLAVLARADVDHEVEVVELEALRHVGVAEGRPHLGVVAHHPEHLVDHLAELVLGLEPRE